MRLLCSLLLLALTACSGPREQIVLLDDAGQLAVTTPRTAQVLRTPYATAAVRDDGRVQTGTTTPAAVQARYGAVLQTLPPAGIVYTLSFAPGSSVLTPASQTTLETALADIASRAACEVLLEGHTDTVGTLEANDRLALARADAVRGLLTQAGLTAAFVRVVGRGERSLLVPTADEVDEPRNRRVEVTVR